MCKNKNCLHIYIRIIVFIEPCIIILQYIIFIYPRIVMLPCLRLVFGDITHDLSLKFVTRIVTGCRTNRILSVNCEK